MLQSNLEDRLLFCTIQGEDEDVMELQTFISSNFKIEEEHIRPQLIRDAEYIKKVL